jgi:hypothetical protein
MYPSVVVGYSIARNIYSSLWWDGYMLEWGKKEFCGFLEDLYSFPRVRNHISQPNNTLFFTYFSVVFQKWRWDNSRFWIK